MSQTVAAPANKAIAFRGKRKPLKEHVAKAAKRGLISEKQMRKIESNV